MAIAIAALGACGGSGPAGSGADAGADTATESRAATTRRGGTGQGQTSVDALGYRVTAEPGTQARVEVHTVADGKAQPPLSSVIVVSAQPTISLFTQYVDSAEITLTVTEGTGATLEAIRGHAADADDPFAALEVSEVLDSAEATPDAPAMVSAP